MIYWQTANLLVDSGSLEGADNTTRYGKMAVAIANMKKNGVKVELPLINEAKRGFIPDADNNKIIYSLKAINGVGDAVVEAIVLNQPFSSIEDFGKRLLETKLVSNSAMINLIKAGCFEKLHNENRYVTMEWFLKKYVHEPNTSLTMANLKKIVTLGVLPKDYELYVRFINFRSYVLQDKFLNELVVNEGKKVPKCGYHDRNFKLDDISMEFFKEHFSTDSVVGLSEDYYVVSEKKFSKEVDNAIIGLKEWFKSKEALRTYNETTYELLRQEKASGTLSAWDMAALSFYYNEHELTGYDLSKYGVVNYFELPMQPEPYDCYFKFVKGEKIAVPKFKIVRLAGTVLQADNNHHMISLLTLEGVVNVKFNKGQYAFYNQQISRVNEDGTKTVVDKSWFKRGTLLMVCGYRQDDNFRAYRYKDTVYLHTVYKITNLSKDDIELLSERASN